MTENTPSPTDTGNTAPAAAPAAAPAGDRPSWLPEKFATPEAFAASYRELEQKQSAGAQPAPAAAPASAPNDPGAARQMEADLSAQGVNINDFYGEYAEHGRLSDASYARLERAGRSRAEVDTYIAGQEALFDQQRASIYQDVGGEQAFQAIQGWAKANLSKAELAGFNAITERGTVEAIRLAVRGLHARYIEANGRAPRLVGGNNATVPEGYASRQEVVAAMSDPRYRKDPAYRDSVIAKMRSGSPFRGR